jgi:hypothetical protein
MLPIASLQKPSGVAGSSITLETNSLLNGSQTLLNLIQGANITLSDDGFGNITITGVDVDSPAVVARGTHSGVIPVGHTLFFGAGALQTNGIALFIATTIQTVTGLFINSTVANGALHTDVYTVFKNGVATGMAVSVTNSDHGTTIAGPVGLVAGDVIWIQCVADAASTAEDICAQIKVI